MITVRIATAKLLSTSRTPILPRMATSAPKNADNTAHQGLDLVRAQSPLPWLHIAEEIASLAVERSYRKVGLLGTRWLMEGPVYPTALSARGITCEIPEREVRQQISALIMGE